MSEVLGRLGDLEGSTLNTAGQPPNRLHPEMCVCVCVFYETVLILMYNLLENTYFNPVVFHFKIGSLHPTSLIS